MSQGTVTDRIRARLRNAGTTGLSATAVVKDLTPTAASRKVLGQLIANGEVVKVGKVYLAASHAPTEENAATLIVKFLISQADQLLSLSGIEKALPAHLKKMAKSAIRSLVALGQLQELKVGRSKVYVHRDAVATWFGGSSGSPKIEDDIFEMVRSAYQKLIENRGGFRTVPIAELSKAAGVAVGTLHELIRNQIDAQRANIYRSSSAMTPKPMLDAAMRLTNDPEPYVSVEFYD